MASSKAFAEVVIAGSYKNLSRATRGAKGELDSLSAKAKKSSAVMKTALAGIGFGAIAKSLVDMARAASEDEQGVRLLAKSMENSIKGHKDLKAGVEATVTSLSMMAAVTDDEIRPAFSYLIRATKSIPKSTKLMTVALDIAAGAHVSVGAAASALGRAYNGNLTALNKLVPGIKGLKNPLDEAAKRFKGMAKIQGENDPFKLMQITADEAKETIGRALLPEIKKLALWLQSKEGQKTVEKTTKAIVELVKEAVKLAKWAIDNKEVIIAIAVALKGWQITSSVIDSWKTLSGIWKGMKPPKVPLPTGGPLTPKGMPIGKPLGPKLPGAGISPLLALSGAAAAVVSMKADSYSGPNGSKNVLGDIARAKAEYGKYYSPSELLLATGKKPLTAAQAIQSGNSNMSPVGATTINIYGAVSGNEVVTALTKYARGKGIPLSKLLK
jgi:hypothetical protein